MVDSTASIVPLHQKRRPQTGAERTRAYRQRKLARDIALLAVSPDVPEEVRPEDLSVTPAAALQVTTSVTPVTLAVTSPVTSNVTVVTAAASPANVTPPTPIAVLPVTASVTPVAPDAALPVTANVTLVTPAAALPVTPNVTPVTPAAALPVTPNVTACTTSHCQVTDGRLNSSHGLTAAALALCGVAVTTSGWFAWSLGSTDLAAWLFLAVGVAADLVLLAVPSAAAQLWHARKGATAVAAWLIWLIASVFAFTGGIGFASSNIADVTLARVSRVTPAVTSAEEALRDAMASRDRECSRGRGRFCQEREHAVDDRVQARNAAVSRVERAADPQTEATIKIVAWLSVGKLKPTADDFAMMRLVLLALLPQLGGLLLMISGRARKNS